MSKHIDFNYDVKKLTSDLEKMCMEIDFDREEALRIVRKIDLNTVFLSSPKRYGFSYKTTFLEEAVESLNIPMVELLLQNGADPNFVDPKGEADDVVWTLQFPDGATEEENDKRLEMADLMLRYGADYDLGDKTGQILTDTISAYKELDPFECLASDQDYHARFMILLIAHGVKSECYPVEVVKEFDKSRLKQYKFKKILPYDRKVAIGIIVDGEGNTVAYV